MNNVENATADSILNEVLEESPYGKQNFRPMTEQTTWYQGFWGAMCVDSREYEEQRQAHYLIR